MPMSNFPNGFANGVLIRGIPVTTAHPGRVMYVNNTTVLPDLGIAGSDGNPGTYLKPYKTLSYAISQCTASRGDVIFLMPGHAETISAAAGIALSKAGVCIVGIGTGTLQPTISFTATASTMTVTAANCTVYNVNFAAGIQSVVAGIVLTATNFTLDTCSFTNSGTATFSFVDAISATTATTNTIAGLTVNNCTYNVTDTTVGHFLNTAGSVDSLTFTNNQLTMGVQNEFPCIFAATGKIFTNLYVSENKLYRNNTTNTLALFVQSSTTGNTGLIVNNKIRGAVTSAYMPYRASGCGYANNLYVHTAETSGFLLPTVDS